MKVKALSLYQPWASFVAAGIKEFETRHWQKQYRGLIAIHAATRWTAAEKHVLAHMKHNFPSALQLIQEPLPFGAMLCIARLVDIIPTENIAHKVSALERAVGDYSPERFAWKLELVEAFTKPIRVPGQPGLWEWEYRKVA